ncbi:MAG: tetratricopeptide repeat protein [Armatimonadota bacterium]
MGEIHALVRRPLSEEADQLLRYLVRRRREGNLQPALVRDVAEAMDVLVPVVRTAGEELHERRLIVLAAPGIIAPLCWPKLTAIAGRGVRMDLAEQLAAVGIEVPSTLLERWAEAETKSDWPPPQAGGDGADDQVWFALCAAAHGALGEALEACRRATASTIAAGVIPLLARFAGWLDRMLVALRAPESTALRCEPPDSENEAARQAFYEAWHEEMIRNRKSAQLAYIRALRADPGYDRARLRYAQTVFDLGEPAQALAELARLTQARPRLGAAHLLRAEMLIKLAEDGHAPEGWLQQAETHLAAAMQDPDCDHGRAWTLRARMLMTQGQTAECAKAARKAIALEPGRPEGYHLLALALTADGLLIEAAWAEAAAVLADHEYIAAAEMLFNLRQAPQVASAVPHARQLIDEMWQ